MAGGDGYKCAFIMSLAEIYVVIYWCGYGKALKMGESNACMKRIVAAPTAGSCGVIPAVLLSYENVWCYRR